MSEENDKKTEFGSYGFAIVEEADDLGIVYSVIPINFET
jgi:hypothetical protein